MEWNRLLSARRYGKSDEPAEEQRSHFQRDYDRIVFCAAFRRLQDKTQVHPFPSSDYVRRRLTHSLEVASVGRSLGFWLGQRVAKSDPTLLARLPNLPHDFGQIVSNACLAHDIGNPPFGHAGEGAIGGWFKENGDFNVIAELDDHERSDFSRFEGNAQGFRLLTRLQNSVDEGGLKLTYATLGAFTKYPCTSTAAAGDDDYVGAKKHGFFKEDLSSFADIADTLGLPSRGDGSWSRHPLVFLVEAADDICYRVVDVEDGLKLGRLSFDEAEDCFMKMLENPSAYQKEADNDANIGWLRAKAIGGLIKGVQAAYVTNEMKIMDGSFASSLIDAIPNAPAIKMAKGLVKERVFNWDRTVFAEISGAQMIAEVLDRCMRAIDAPGKQMSELILKVLPRHNPSDPPVRRIHAATDFVSGMTDSYLRTIYLRFTGHAII